MRFLLFIILGVLGFSCTSQLASNHGERHQINRELDDMRTELADVKHVLKSTQLQLQIVEERLQDGKSKGGSRHEQIAEQLSGMQRKISQLEKMQESVVQDLKQLSGYANQANASLKEYREKVQEVERAIAAHERRLDEVVKLKSTLTSISKSIGQKSSADASHTSYKIKPGDSLEKIARHHGTTVEAIKRANRLDRDRIIVGQEIKIPNDE